MGASSFDAPYLHGKETDEESFNYLSAQDAFIVFLAGNRSEYHPDVFLQRCWTNGLDTVCSLCNADFDLGTAPPVRLLNLKQNSCKINPMADTQPHLTVTNSHLRCLKLNKVKYLPVSHAWHHSVAKAYALRVSNPEATRACYEVPIRTLLAVRERFGPDMYLWHDYISIPQWQEEFRGTSILPQIFDIFHNSACALVNLTLKPPIELLEIYSPETFLQHASALQRLFEAHWFARMWPLIEFDRAGDAYIMNSNYKILPTKFSRFIKQITDEYNNYVNMVESSCSAVSGGALKWVETLPLFAKERHKTKCLGYVFDMIATKGCRSYRDKFIGASALLSIPGYPTILPQNTQDACLWLAESCLERNDFSPLLLHPSNEPKYSKACWLKGHTLMTPNMWGLGVQTRAAKVAPRIENHKVYLKLQLSGEVTDTFSWKIRDEDNSYGFPDVLPNLVRLVEGDASRFLKTVENIYPYDFFWTTDENSDIYNFPAMEYKVKGLGTVGAELEHLLERYSKANSAKDIVNCKTVCEAIISLLELFSPPTSYCGPFRNVGRLQLYSRLCAPMECTLISVSCPKCERGSIFRAAMWKESRGYAQLYHIPELAYQHSVPGGMGIVVEDGEIIGRVRLAAPECYCDLSTTGVELSGSSRRWDYRYKL